MARDTGRSATISREGMLERPGGRWFWLLRRRTRRAKKIPTVGLPAARVPDQSFHQSPIGVKTQTRDNSRQVWVREECLTAG
jgi:hypothetical protein